VTQGRDVLTEVPAGPGLDCLDEGLDAMLRIARDQQVYLVGHRFELEDRRVLLGANLTDDLLEPLDGAFDGGSPVLRVPPDGVPAALDDVALRSGLIHTKNMQRQCVP